MPKSRPPRKKQAGRKFNPATHAIVPSLFATSPSRSTWIKLAPHTRLDSIAEGIGTKFDLEVLKGRINVGYVLVTQLFSELEAAAVMLTGLDVIRAIEARDEKYPRFVDLEECQLLGDALNLADEVQDATTRKEQATALQLVHKTCNIPNYALSLLSV